MDELVRHCIREISFDGDLGSDVSRLHIFIKDFYGRVFGIKQTLDDSFNAFVWSLLVQQPAVRVGRIPPGLTTEVYIAPQPSAVKKGKAKAETADEDRPRLELILNAEERTLDDLKVEFGNALRIAVDPEEIFAAITGSHIKPQKMTPMVYTALQLITRGRENGITVVELGQRSKYDQKTCFYLVKQLIELNLVVKVRRGGVGTHMCLHRYFYENSPRWKEVREEESKAQEIFKAAPEQDTGQVEEETGPQTLEDLGFSPIDARHLSSLPLIKGRVIKLLKASHNHIHASNNMLLKIGFAHPTKTDRRFFNTRIRELVQLGLIEAILVPSLRRGSEGKMIKCFRLVTPEAAPTPSGAVVAQVDEDEEDREETSRRGGLRKNMTLHKQIVDLLEEAGTSGMIMTELSARLGDFDKRTIDLLLTRAERQTPPSHLSDLGIAIIMENYGRERRNRYFTAAAYRQLLADENLDTTNAGNGDVDLSEVGRFATVTPDMFYSDEGDLARYHDTFLEKHGDGMAEGKAEGKKAKKRAKAISTDGGEAINRKRQKKDKATKGEIGINEVNTVKQKSGAEEAVSPRKGKKRKQDDEDDHSRPKKKSRHAKSQAASDQVADGEGAQVSVSEPTITNEPISAVATGIAAELIAQTHASERPPTQQIGTVQDPNREVAGTDQEPTPEPRKRGRPRKSQLPDSKAASGHTEVKSNLSITQQPSTGIANELTSVPRERGRLRKPEVAVGNRDGGEAESHAQGSSPQVPTSDHQPAPRKRPHNHQPATETEAVHCAELNTPDGRPRHSLDLESAMEAKTLSNDRPKRKRTRTAKAMASDKQYPGSGKQQGPSTALQKPSVDLLAFARPENSRALTVDIPDMVVLAGPLTPFGGSLSPITPEPISPLSKHVDNVPPASATDSVRGQVQPNEATFLQDNSSPRMNNMPIDPMLLSESQPSVKAIPSSATMETAPQSQPTRAPKANVSHMRRGNEFHQVIVNMGGIANVNTKEFTDAHSALIETLAQSGEPTSAPVGTRVDKRTVQSTLDSMESKGRIKIIKTQIMTRTGVPRPTTVVHIPDIDQAKLIDYLSNLSDTVTIPAAASIKRLEERVEYGAASSERKVALPLQLLRGKHPIVTDTQERWSKNSQRSEQLWQYDQATIREVLLTERTTVGQFYGFIVGKAARLRKFHLTTISAFEEGNSSSNIVSRQDRIVHLAFYNHDLPLGIYLSLFSVLTYNEDLTQFYRSEGGAQTLVKDLPPSLHTVLQIGRSRARSRALDLMELLMYLQLATPLQPTDSSTPWIQCAANGEHPTCFDKAPLEGWTSGTPNVAPSYWQFSAVAPIFSWSISDGSSVFRKETSVRTHADASEFWIQLKEACLRKNGKGKGDTFDVRPPRSLNDASTKTLRKSSSWDDQYRLTWHQQQYLSRALHDGAGMGRADHAFSVVDTDRLAWIISAPAEKVRAFLSDTRNQYEKVVAKAHRKRERLIAEKVVAEANKMLLADMAAEARAQREADWNDIVARVHSTPLKGSTEVRLRPVRKKFLQAVSVKDIEKWEEEIRKTLREAALTATKVLSKRPKKTVSPPTAQLVTSETDSSPPVVHNPAEKSVVDLIAQQGPALPDAKRNPPKKRRKKEEEPGMEPGGVKYRRHRFQWDDDYEELARDASTIIRARCRDLPRLELAALDQVFPAVPRNTVRQRLAHIRDTPGNEAYLKRLEDKWYDLWIRHRGTDLLPDDDPQSASNFDLVKHIEFLRKHIDKNALRVGFTSQTNLIVVPETVDKLLETWDVVEPPVVSTMWDFMWKGDGEEGREKALCLQSFYKGSILPSIARDDNPEDAFIAESALKMVFGTPNERYDPEVAASLLRAVGEVPVYTATKNLLNRGVLSKHVRDPKKEKPGRRLKISDINQNALGGSTAFDTFQDAVALDEDISLQQEETWRTWPLLATDGDLASLLQQVSDNKVEFRIDTSAARVARTEVEWNSKKADDDQIETAIEVRFLDPEMESIPIVSPSPVIPVNMDDEPDEPEHGVTFDGSAASCRKTSPHLPDCYMCLAKATDKLVAVLAEEEVDLLHRLLNVLLEAGEKGLSKSEILGYVDACPPEQAMGLVQRLTNMPVPLAFWTGYTKSVLVSSHHLKAWSVLVSHNPLKRVLPRRWLDISGNKDTDVWDAALRAVIGAIHFRPGITEAELRWRLRSVYDRQEVNDILQALQINNFINIVYVDLPLARGHFISGLDAAEEVHVYCFINHAKHWYMV